MNVTAKGGSMTARPVRGLMEEMEVEAESRRERTRFTVAQEAFVPAVPGWRVVIIDRANSEAGMPCPIVLWRVAGDRAEPYFIDPDGLQAVRVLVEEDWFVGYLTPGEDYDEAWVEASKQVYEAEREDEERREARST